MKFGSWLNRILEPKRRRPPVRMRPVVEALEDRCLMSAEGLFYSIDGTGNNLAHPEWGSAGQQLLRTAPAQYADGSSTMAGSSRPGARLVSSVLVTDSSGGQTPSSQFLSAWVYTWGQFIDHDLDLTFNASGDQAEAANIPVPTGDPYFDPSGTGTQIISFNRSEYNPATGTGPDNPRQQINRITAWLDGSQIYGSDAATADALRTHVGGRLKTSAGELLPIDPNSGMFLAGDIRVNENPALAAVHTLFVREHNRIAALMEQADPSLDDESLYQMARAIVIGEVQSITFNEYLPALLGPTALSPYSGYNPAINPNIANEFSTAAYRFGHSMVASDIEFLNPDGTTAAPALSLADTFFNPTPILELGIDPIVKYLATDNSQEVDIKIIPELQNFLFGQPGQGGFDLAALNIQRGRDHGLADYNTVRTAYGLPPVKRFSQITSDRQLQARLRELYGTVNNIDLWVGGLAEKDAPGSNLGPLFQRIIASQFQRLRDGDRLWYENVFSGAALQSLRQVTLSQIISQNTDNDNLQANVFYFRIEVTGTVFNDVNGNGLRDPREGGLRRRVVQLLDADGNVLAQTTTLRDGSYRFNNLNSPVMAGATFQVRLVPARGDVQYTASPASFTFTRGEVFDFHDFGVSRKPALGALVVGAAVDTTANDWAQLGGSDFLSFFSHGI